MDDTCNQAQRNPDGTLKKGYSGNPRGVSAEQHRQATKIRGMVYNEFIAEFQRFLDWAENNQTEFHKLVFSLLPKEIKGEGFANNNTNIFQIIEDLRRSVQGNSDTSVGMDTGDGIHKR